jgi:hypothetical protein
MSFERRASQARELRQIMQDELESAVNSLELTTLQRDLLWQEFGLYRYAELNFSPKLPDEPKQHPARTPKKPIRNYSGRFPAGKFPRGGRGDDVRGG